MIAAGCRIGVNGIDRGIIASFAVGTVRAVRLVEIS